MRRQALFFSAMAMLAIGNVTVARAAMYEITYTGMAYEETPDDLGLFSSVGDTVAPSSYTLTYTFDTAQDDTARSSTSTGPSYISYSFQFDQPGSIPTAVLSIGSKSFNFTSYEATLPGSSTDVSFTEFDEFIENSNYYLQMDVYLDGNYGIGFGSYGDMLYNEAGFENGLPVGYGGYLQIINSNGASLEDIDLVPASATTNFPLAPLSAVPEPSGWAMLLFGLGAVGGFLRRRARDGSGRLGQLG